MKLKMQKDSVQRFQCINGRWIAFPATCLLLLITFTGCYERNLAPPVEYSQEELDKLNSEIHENIDWDD